MSAGTGILHSEFNHSQTDSVHFLQIWLLPEKQGLSASYEQRDFSPANHPGKLHLVAAKNGREGSLTVHQDLDLYAAVLEPNQGISYTLKTQRHAWVQVARGAISLNNLSLEKSDGAAISEEAEIVIEATTDAEFLLFDLA
jgi:redox-sensitive bicupin YhaK (pirin superfamily)